MLGTARIALFVRGITGFVVWFCMKGNQKRSGADNRYSTNELMGVLGVSFSWLGVVLRKLQI